MDDVEPFGLSNKSCLDGRQVSLRTIEQADYPFLRRLETGHPEPFIRFRHRGVSTSPESWVQTLWQGVLSQFLVTSKKDGAPLGLVTAYGADFRNGRCHIATIVLPTAAGSGIAMEAMTLHINYLFGVFPFRKLTAEVLDFNWPNFAGGEGRMFVREGTLHQHEFHGGQYWDLHLIAIFRERWTNFFEVPAEVRAGLQLPTDDRLPSTFAMFANRLATNFEWSGVLDESCRLREDLNCDSIAYVELLLVLESLTDSEINDEAFIGIDTLGELFQLYLAFLPDEPVNADPGTGQ